MKIAILTTGPFYANGIGGVETMITLKYNWLKRNNHEVKVFNYCPSIPKRKKKDFVEVVKYEYESYDKTLAKELVEELDKFDAVIFEKEATVQCGFTFDMLNVLYHDVWKKISTKKFLWQHNGLAKSLNKYPYVLGFINEADGIIHLSPESEYVQEMVLKLPSKQNRSFRSTVFTDFSEFDDMEKNQERENKIVYLGRPVSIKEPYRLLNMAPYLKARGIESEIHGADSSMAGLNYVLTRENAIDCVRKNGKTDGITKCYGPYKREDGLEILRNSMFGCNFFNYRKKGVGTYGDRLECTMHEIICCGAIPVFDKHFAENCKTFFTKERYIDIPHFAIWSEPTEEGFEETAKEMEMIMKDKALQQKYRENAYKILKENFDINVHMPLLLDFISNTSKDTEKFKSEKDLVEFVTGNKEQAELFERVMNEGFLMHMAPSSLLKGKVCSLPNRTNKRLIEHE